MSKAIFTFCVYETLKAEFSRAVKAKDRTGAQAYQPGLVKLVWTCLASIDQKEIRAYIAKDNPAAALAFDELFSEKTG